MGPDPAMKRFIPHSAAAAPSKIMRAEQKNEQGAENNGPSPSGGARRRGSRGRREKFQTETLPAAVVSQFESCEFLPTLNHFGCELGRNRYPVAVVPSSLDPAGLDP